jgi:exosortase/archaeosortase family protein
MRLGSLSLSGGLNPRQERLWRALVFLARLLALSLPLYLVIWLGIDLYPLQLAAASQSGWLLQATGYRVVQDGTGLLVNDSFEFFIIPDCTGWKSMLFLFALVLSVPGPGLRRRMWGLALGLPLVWLGNLTRIWCVVLVQGVWGTETAMFMHNIPLQAGMAALVLGIWIAWLKWKGFNISAVSWRR